MDDILIYSETMEEHVAMVRKVMERLRKARLCVSIKKSSFHIKEVEFLGYKISDRGISMRTKKVEEITAWSPPQKVVDVQSYMGFANFYNWFIKGFSKKNSQTTNRHDKEGYQMGLDSCLSVGV